MSRIIPEHSLREDRNVLQLQTTSNENQTHTASYVGAVFPSRQGSPAYRKAILVDPAAALPRTIFVPSMSNVAGKSTAWLSGGLYRQEVNVVVIGYKLIAIFIKPTYLVV